MLDLVCIAVAWQRVQQIRYRTYYFLIDLPARAKIVFLEENGVDLSD
jgi:hypothetical protein